MPVFTNVVEGVFSEVREVQSQEGRNVLAPASLKL
jgi:hypothetical protein